MNEYCAFLGLSAELRNLIYEYVAINEGVLIIKKKCRPKNGQHITARSGLLLCNRQISQEYLSLVQAVPAIPNIALETWVHDFNFRHLEKYLSSPHRHKSAAASNLPINVHLVVRDCHDLDPERFARWINVDDRRWISIAYRVDDDKSGYQFPVPPPTSFELWLFRRCASESDQAEAIYRAVWDWRQRCEDRVYRLKSGDPSKRDIFVKWTVSQSWAYHEIPAGQATGCVVDVWLDSR